MPTSDASGMVSGIDQIDERVPMKIKTLAVLGLVSVLTGCAQLQKLQLNADADSAPCPECNTGKQAYYATAVTRPGLCNDYPVEYRVQIPETDARVRPVDRVFLNAGKSTTSTRSCGK